MNKKAFRHGEVLFVKIDKLPDGLKKSESKIIVKGSHGHDHTFDSGKLYLRNVNNFVIGYFVANNTTLFHPEHGAGKGQLKKAKIPNGIYEIRKQQEYTPDGLKPVVD